MIYAIIMAIAFVAAVSLATILIVSKKKEKEAQAEEETLMAPVSPVKPARQTERQQTRQEVNDVHDRRELVYQAQRPDRDDFGYTEKNPVCTATTASAEKYLSLLRTPRGEPFQWLKERNTGVREVPGSGNVPVEIYTLYLHGKAVKRIYLCPCGKNSASAPKGMKLSSENVAPFGGSIAREAREKGISEEQVLKKHALIYESNMEKQRASSLNLDRKPEELSERSARPQARPVTPSRQEAPKPAEKASEKSPAPLTEKQKQKEEAPAPASFPHYLPGFEPDNIRPSLEKFLAVMDRVYPDGIVLGSTWDHEHWDRAAAMLCKYLGYANGTDFLEAYGYQVQK